MDTNNHSLMTIQEVSDLTRVPVATLRYWRHQTSGPKSARFGGRLMYRREDVEKWVSEAFATGRSA